jgi:ABC-type antimicrobial peptide transport system permease subunit
MSLLRDQYAEPIGIVFAVVGVVLLLTCANVANLLPASASGRQREMAVRKSLGAGRCGLLPALRALSVILQISSSLVLLVVSALLVRTLVNLRTLDAGFGRRNVFLATVQFRARAATINSTLHGTNSFDGLP